MNLSETILKISLKILLVGSLLISGLLIISSTWEIYAISTNRGGLNYNYYIYLGLSKGEILFYDIIILIIFSILAISQILILKNGNNQRIILVLVIFTFLFLLFITYDTYLNSQFVPKG